MVSESGAGRSLGPQSLLDPTIRRSLRSGRFTLAVGIAWSGILGVAIGVSSGSAFVSSFPFVLPIFASMGCIGPLTVFTSDRMKGTLEYLMAYGVSPRTLLSNFMIASLVAVSVVLGVSIGAGLGAFLASGNRLSVLLALLLLAYAVPMSYVSAALAMIVGMYWSALSSPREGMNSPIGLAPFVSLAPPVATLVAISVLAATVGASPTGFVVLAGAALGVVLLVVLVLLGSVGRLLRRERFLSTT